MKRIDKKILKYFQWDLHKLMHFNVCNIFLKPWNIISSLFKASVAIKIKKCLKKKNQLK